MYASEIHTGFNPSQNGPDRSEMVTDHVHLSMKTNELSSKWIVLLLFYCLTPIVSSGQIPCALEVIDPNYLHKQRDLDAQWVGYIRQNSSSPEAAWDTLTLPVVFHIVHDGGPENISDARIKTALDNLNLAFANQGYYDQSAGVNTLIRFCLAKQDPGQQSSSGITRTFSPLTQLTVENSDIDLKNLSRWEPTCYINIWIVREITSLSAGSSVAGYAYLPYEHGSLRDGIVVEARHTGVNQALGSILAHEMGHYLGLYHTFEGGCQNQDCLSEGDRVCDTPPDNSVITTPCNHPANSCQTDTDSGFSTDQNDMISNFMDYSGNSCQHDFTTGQAERMRFYILDVRKSLLNCVSCQDPCLLPLTAQISGAPSSIPIGDTLRLSALVSPMASEYLWTINGIPTSQGPLLVFPTDTTAKLIIILQAEGNAPGCIAADTVCIEVYCPLTTKISASRQGCILPTETVLFTHNVSDHDTTQWYVNGILVSNKDTLSQNFSSSGVYEVRLVIKNKWCSYTSPVQKVYVGCQEICDNGQDDDGDGLVDDFDPDCCRPGRDHYYQICTIQDSCSEETSTQITPVKIKWAYLDVWGSGNTPLVGDVNGDGKTDIVGLGYELSPTNQEYSIKVLDGATGRLTYVKDIGPLYFGQSFSMADTDGDGSAEIFYGDFGSSLIRNDITPGGIEEVWNSPHNTHLSRNTSICDFNADGRPEILIDNCVIDSKTGRVLLPFDNIINAGVLPWSYSASGSMGCDVLPDNFCPQCEGLELVVGNEVYSIAIDTQSLTATKRLEVRANGSADGLTTVVDFDLDGDLDAVIVSFNGKMGMIDVWDIQTPSMLTPTYSFISEQGAFGYGLSCVPACGYLNGDAYPDVVFSYPDGPRASYLEALSFSSGQWNLLFKKKMYDPSGASGAALFDFDNDQQDEIVFRDQSDLYILKGDDGAVLYQTPCQSSTGHDSPSIADIDNDGHAEIVCSCENRLLALESADDSWAFTRPVWNQNKYFCVNIEDDLSIPVSQQAHHLPQRMNGVFRQYGYLRRRLPDLEVNILDMHCDSSQLVYTLEVCNRGQMDIDQITPLKVVLGTPSDPGAKIVDSLILQIQGLASGDCITIEDKIDVVANGWYHFILNIETGSTPPFDMDSLFAQSHRECIYANNVDSFSFLNTTTPPMLGPDTSICKNAVLSLSTHGHFESYQWSDGSKDSTTTIYGPGTYWVRVFDRCGQVYTDSLVVRSLPDTPINLGTDTTICQSDTLAYDIPGFMSYSWYPADKVDCDTCASIQLKASSSNTTLSLIAQDSQGCLVSDSVRIKWDTSLVFIQQYEICGSQDSVFINGQWYDTTGVIEQIKHSAGRGCDSIYRHIISQADHPELSIAYDSSNCTKDSICSYFTLYNHGSRAPNPIVSISLYDCNPTRETCTPTRTVEADISNLGSQQTQTIVIKHLPIGMTFYIILNDDGSILAPFSLDTLAQYGLPECNYNNNIDSFSIIDLPEPFDLGRDTSICEGERVLLDQDATATTVWNGWLIQDSLWIDTSGLYTASTQYCGVTFTDSLYLEVRQNPKVDLTADTSLCPGDTLHLSLPGHHKYYWSGYPLACDTCAMADVVPDSSGWLIVNFQDTFGCHGKDSLWIGLRNDVLQIFDTAYLCDPGDSIYWLGKWYHAEGVYDTLFSNGQGVCDTLFQLSVIPSSQTGRISYGPYHISEKRSIRLLPNGNINQVTNIDWLETSNLSCDTCVSPLWSGSQNDTLTVVITYDGNCSDSLIVYILFDSSTVFIPNIFTPNEDDVNDHFIIYGNDETHSIEDIQIYSRWGELVFQAGENVGFNQPLWDGTFSGKKLRPSVYAYIIKIKNIKTGNLDHMRGSITLIY